MWQQLWLIQLLLIYIPKWATSELSWSICPLRESSDVKWFVRIWLTRLPYLELVFAVYNSTLPPYPALGSLKSTGHITRRQMPISQTRYQYTQTKKRAYRSKQIYQRISVVWTHGWRVDGFDTSKWYYRVSYEWRSLGFLPFELFCWSGGRRSAFNCPRPSMISIFVFPG